MSALKPGETCSACGHHEMTREELDAEIERLGLKAARIAGRQAEREPFRVAVRDALLRGITVPEIADRFECMKSTVLSWAAGATQPRPRVMAAVIEWCAKARREGREGGGGSEKRCRAETTIRDDEHRTYRCFLPLGHEGNHESGQTTVEWTDETTRPRVLPDTPDSKFMQHVGAYVDDWRDGDDAWHAAGHIEELVRQQKPLRERLLALWDEAHEELLKAAGQSGMEEEFAAWSGATKDFLMFLGLDWDNEKDRYVFVDKEQDDG